MEKYDWIARDLEKARTADRLRAPRAWPAVGGRLVWDGREVLNFASNDYLDLARHPHVVERAQRALQDYGAGATASRLVCGTLPIHEELEARLAAYKGRAAARLFGSGYLTNAGIVTALAGPGDDILTDRLAHASILDAARLSGARLRRFRHNDAGHLATLLERPARGRRLVVVESVYSMDGDLSPLDDMAALAERHDALLVVDEAHATGIFGPGGRGRVLAAGLEQRVDVCMGTLSKGLGSYGGFAAAPNLLCDWFANRARSFIYTTAPPPAAVGAALGALDVLEREPDRGRDLLARAERFRGRLQNAGLDTLQSRSQIIPLLAGSNRRALDLAARLRAQGLLTVAMRPPTVPEGTARIRLSVTLAHRDEDLERAANILAEAFTERSA